MKLRRALIAGFSGSLVATLLCAAAIWLLRLDVDVRFAMSRTAARVLPWPAWVVIGAGVILGGTAIGIGYALVFELVTRRAGPVIGAALGVAQASIAWLAAGLGLQYLPGAAELFAREASILFGDLEATAAFFVIHAAYGAIVGVVYGRPRHEPETNLRVTWREIAGEGNGFREGNS